ncbi:MAG TPA: group II intron reverse transcriptase/maturase [Chloroflexota bacterium]
MSERPVHRRVRRLVEWLNPTGTKKVHSLVDKVYQRKNLEIAWEQVRANRGSGGVDGESLETFGAQLDRQLDRLHTELRQNTYRPQPVRQVRIPKAGKPGEFRTLGIPTIYDRVCQQALLNRLEPIFEPVFDEANFGYRRGRSTKDALRKIWREIHSGREWIVDADLKDFFGSVEHEKLLRLIAQQVADGRVLRLIQAMLEAGSCRDGRVSATKRGTPQGGVISPVLSNILLTPFDWEMRARGYALTRYADDWVITCTSEAEAARAIADAQRILAKLGVQLHPQKTRIVHINRGFEFLGYQIKRGRPRAALRRKLGRSAPAGTVYAYPSEKSINRLKDEVRQLTKRRMPLLTEQIIAEMNPILRGWGQYYKRSHVRRLFTQLDAWIVRRLWSHRCKRWRCEGWKQLPQTMLYGELGLVSLLQLLLLARSP